MKYSILIVLLLTLQTLMAEDSAEHEQFAEDYILQFDFGMSIDKVREILLKERENLEFFNNCTEEFEYPMTDCAKGYSLVTTIKLPNSDKLDRGDLQLYFSFNAKQSLTNSFYEIYYTGQNLE